MRKRQFKTFGDSGVYTNGSVDSRINKADSIYSSHSGMKKSNTYGGFTGEITFKKTSQFTTEKFNTADIEEKRLTPAVDTNEVNKAEKQALLEIYALEEKGLGL